MERACRGISTFHESLLGTQGRYFRFESVRPSVPHGPLVLLVAAERDEGSVVSKAVCVRESVPILSMTS